MALAQRLFFWEDWIEGVFTGNPRILWNGNTLSFPGPPTMYHYRRRRDAVLDFSGGRVAATSLRSQFDEARIVLDGFDNAQFEADLAAWWSWAARGKAYDLALDDSETVDRTLSGAAAAGQKDIPMTNTSGITVGRFYLLREAIGEEEEIIKVDSIVVNVKVVALANLKFGYLTGDVFRSRDYFPKMVATEDDKPWQQKWTTWIFDHTATEDKG